MSRQPRSALASNTAPTRHLSQEKQHQRWKEAGTNLISSMPLIYSSLLENDTIESIIDIYNILFENTNVYLNDLPINDLTEVEKLKDTKLSAQIIGSVRCIQEVSGLTQKLAKQEINVKQFHSSINKAFGHEEVLKVNNTNNDWNDFGVQEVPEKQKAEKPFDDFAFPDQFKITQEWPQQDSLQEFKSFPNQFTPFDQPDIIQFQSQPKTQQNEWIPVANPQLSQQQQNFFSAEQFEDLAVPSPQHSNKQSYQEPEQIQGINPVIVELENCLTPQVKNPFDVSQELDSDKKFNFDDFFGKNETPPQQPFPQITMVDQIPRIIPSPTIIQELPLDVSYAENQEFRVGWEQQSAQAENKIGDFEDWFKPNQQESNEQQQTTQNNNKQVLEDPVKLTEELKKPSVESKSAINQEEFNFDDFEDLGNEDFDKSVGEDSQKQFQRIMGDAGALPQHIENNSQASRNISDLDDLLHQDWQGNIKPHLMVPLEVTPDKESEKSNGSDRNSVMLRSNPFTPIPPSEMAQYMNPQEFAANSMDRFLYAPKETEAPFHDFPFLDTVSPAQVQFDKFLFDQQEVLSEIAPISFKKKETQQDVSAPQIKREIQLEEQVVDKQLIGQEQEVAKKQMVVKETEKQPEMKQSNKIVQTKDIEKESEMKQSNKSNTSQEIMKQPRKSQNPFDFDEDEEDSTNGQVYSIIDFLNNDTVTKERQRREAPMAQIMENAEEDAMTTPSQSIHNPNYFNQSHVSQVSNQSYSAQLDIGTKIQDSLYSSLKQPTSNDTFQRLQLPIPKQRYQESLEIRLIDNSVNISQDVKMDTQDQNLTNLMNDSYIKQAPTNASDINYLQLPIPKQRYQESPDIRLIDNSVNISQDVKMDTYDQNLANLMNASSQESENQSFDSVISHDNFNQQLTTFEQQQTPKILEHLLIEEINEAPIQKRVKNLENVHLAPQSIQYPPLQKQQQAPQSTQQTNLQSQQVSNEIKCTLSAIEQRLSQFQVPIKEQSQRVSALEQTLANLAVSVERSQNKIFKALESVNHYASKQDLEQAHSIQQAAQQASQRAIQQVVSEQYADVVPMVQLVSREVHELRNIVEQQQQQQGHHRDLPDGLLQKIEGLQGMVTHSNQQLAQLNEQYEWLITNEKQKSLVYSSEKEVQVTSKNRNTINKSNQMVPLSPLDANFMLIDQDVISSPRRSNHKPAFQYSTPTQKAFHMSVNAKSVQYMSQYMDSRQTIHANLQSNRQQVDNLQDGFDQSILSLKTNGVFIQKYLRSSFADSYKRMCIQDSCVLLDTFELFISTRYETVDQDNQDPPHSLLKLTVIYRNKSHVHMNHLVVIVNSQKSSDHFFVEPLKVSRPSLAPNESVKQEFMFKEFDPNIPVITCAVGYMLSYTKRQFTVHLARPFTRFLNCDFVGHEDLQDLFVQHRSQLVQSEIFSLGVVRSVEELPSLFPWLIELEQEEIYSAGAKGGLWIGGKYLSLLIRFQQNQAKKCVCQIALLDNNNMKLVESLLSFLSFIVGQ